MVDIEKHRLLKYPLFTSLYFSQGIIFALGVMILPIYFIDSGIDIAIATSVVSIAYIPWIIKFVFGGICDYFIKFGRKKFIFIGGIMSVISFFILAGINPKSALLPFIILIFIGSAGITFLDVSADAWAIQITKVRERGKINAAMFGGLFLGTAISLPLFGFIAENFGYPLVFTTASIIVMMILVFPLTIKENILVKKQPKIAKLLLQEFKKKTTILTSIFSSFSAISFGILSVVLPLYMVLVLDLKLSQVGLIVGIGQISTVVGNIFGGFITDKWGRKKILFVFFLINILFVVGLIFGDTWLKILVLWIIIGFAHGGHYAAMGAMLMDITNQKVGAAQYSILTSFTNLGEMGGVTFSGTLITTIGFSRLFLFSAWIYGPALLILYFIRLKTEIK
jgi:PAT family beta-lactamase induction signal transducer AmpG